MPDFAAGQIVTVFRNRLRPDNLDDYSSTMQEIGALAVTMPGLVDVKTFTADDGERATIVTFADEATQRAWREQADHRVAQQQGRDAFYAEYSLQVCTTLRARSFATPTLSFRIGYCSAANTFCRILSGVSMPILNEVT